jgi:hypothetical protein
VALYSVSIKTISRSRGQSAVAAAAYKNAESIKNQCTGKINNHQHRAGVDYVEAFAPAGTLPVSSAKLWNLAEAAEVRSNAIVAREVSVALPDELDPMQRQSLATAIAQDLADHFRIAGTLAIHLPDVNADALNHCAHILMTTRRIDASGLLGEKLRELDDLTRGSQAVEWIRWMIEERINLALERAGSASRVDRRSLVAQRRDALAASNERRAAQLDPEATFHEGSRMTRIRREAAGRLCAFRCIGLCCHQRRHPSVERPACRARRCFVEYWGG